jgi:hypothetical protein
MPESEAPPEMPTVELVAEEEEMASEMASEMTSETTSETTSDDKGDIAPALG